MVVIRLWLAVFLAGVAMTMLIFLDGSSGPLLFFSLSAMNVGIAAWTYYRGPL
jgi:hypothetical protein